MSFNFSQINFLLSFWIWLKFEIIAISELALSLSFNEIKLQKLPFLQNSHFYKIVL